jgi:hypothetical protein
MTPGEIIECPSLLWPLVATSPGDITVCPSLLWVTDKRTEHMKLFNMVNEVGQHAIDRGCSKDTFGNMQVGPVTVFSKKETDDIYGYTRN